MVHMHSPTWARGAKKLHSMAESTLCKGSISISGHDLIKLGEKETQAHLHGHFSLLVAGRAQAVQGGASQLHCWAVPPQKLLLFFIPWKVPGSEWDVSVMLTPEVSSARGPHCDRASPNLQPHKGSEAPCLTKHWAQQRFVTGRLRAGQVAWQPLACHRLPSNYTKQKQHERKDGGKCLLPTITFPSPIAACTESKAQSIKAKAQGKCHLLSPTAPSLIPVWACASRAAQSYPKVLNSSNMDRSISTSHFLGYVETALTCKGVRGKDN